MEREPRSGCDGDHSAEGVRRDLADLLASDSVRQTVVLLHDTMNEEVRAGIEQAQVHKHPKATYLDLDFAGAGLPGSG